MSTTEETPVDKGKRNISMPSRMIKMFDGQNYQVWAIHMKDILRECRLLKYIEATVHDYEEHEDIQALTKICFTLSDNQICLIIHCESTHGA